MAPPAHQRTILPSHQESDVGGSPGKSPATTERTVAKGCSRHTEEIRGCCMNESVFPSEDLPQKTTFLCPDLETDIATSFIPQNHPSFSHSHPSQLSTTGTSGALATARAGSCILAEEDEQMHQFLSALEREFKSSRSLSTLALASLPSFSCAFGSHEKIIGLVKSLQANYYLVGEQAEQLVWTVTQEGKRYISEGTPEFYLMQSLAQDVANHQDLPEVGQLKASFPFADVALNTAMKNGWVDIEKDTRRIQIRRVPSVDVVRELLKAVENQHHQCCTSPVSGTFDIHRRVAGGEVEREERTVKREMDSTGQEFSREEKQRDTLSTTGTNPKKEEDDFERLYQRVKLLKSDCSPENTLQNLKRRKLLDSKKVKYLIIRKGEKFALNMRKRLTDLTADVLISGAWKTAEIKEYNFFSSGRKQMIGGVHPLTRVLRYFSNILMRMGFEEMETNQYVEPSFWCFDSLFMPQQHPARDVQDTFFLLNPACSDMTKIPPDYVQRVRAAHEEGTIGSIGWQYPWSEEEAKRNVLRTHTTATSAQLLYALAQEYQRTGNFVPRKFFSIDRVFRNETLDATHLAEFHQVEGLVADRGLSLGHLIGVMKTFYEHIGIHRLRFKPAYNPYTEPSMEIFGYHTGLKKWIEVGNSGIFRPEMLQPMGLPADVTVIAWGLSLERPTMIRYGISNIRDLFGARALLGCV